ncbi:MAG: replicative DNA helicase [Clostridiales bacterium]|nr:replicative DNA helicase [Clostridiales bacterium]
MDKGLKGRIPPNSVEAEQCVIGSMLLDQDAIAEVFSVIKSNDYYRNEHKLIHDAIESIFTSGRTPDIVTVSEWLKKDGSFDKVGGLDYLAKLAETPPSTSSARHYAEIVEEKSLLRTLIKSSMEIVEKGYNNQDDAKMVLNLAQQNIFDLVKNKDEKGVTHISEVLSYTLKEITKRYKDGGLMPGLKTHFTELDKITGGLANSDLILIAARPSMGKSALAVNLGQNVAIKEGKNVAIFSLEMSKDQVVNRILSSEASIPNDKLRKGDITPEDIKKLAMLSGEISQANLYIDDTAGITTAEIRAKCRRLKIQNKLDLVIIDYLQLIQGTNKKDSRTQEVSEISRNLKIMAKDLQIPVIALSQLSRGPESRSDKRPMLSDLRESGAIEQDADIVMFIYRDEYYNPKTEEPNIAEIIISKNRNGSTKTVKLRWFDEFTRFSNLLPG